MRSAFLKAAFAILAGIALGMSSGSILGGDGARTFNEEIKIIKDFFRF
ncbi:MAG: hypothetical protein GX780_02310 [Campylobacteraceae bacterium]|nr:hypothetical protein [Campylobacteraceae bacterium]